MKQGKKNYYKIPENVPDLAAHIVARAAQPLLRRFDNPFFALEMQLLACKTRKIEEGPVLLAISAMAFCFFCALLSKFTGMGYSGDVAIAWVAFFQFVFCGGVASWASRRIFQREHIAGTLLDTFMLPIGPTQWIVMKSVLVWHVLVLAWATALPFEVVLYFVGDVLPSTLLLALLLPLWLGLIVWAFALLLVPDYLCDPPRPAPQGEYSRAPWQEKSFALQSANVARYLLAVGFGFVSYIKVMRLVFQAPQEFDSLFELRYFYDAIAPAGLFWITLNVGFFAAAIAHSAAMLSPEYQGRRRAAAICWCALASSYYTGLGFYWPLRPELWHWAALIAPPFLVAIFGRLSEKWLPAPAADGENAVSTPKRRLWRFLPEDWSRREINALARAYDNPIFIKDLRVHLRGSSLFAQLFWSLFWAAITLVFINKMGLAGGGNWWIWLAGYFASPAARCVMMWQQEARGVTLTMMLLSPLGSREIILGRFWAGLITGMVWPVMGLCILIWICFRFNLTTRFALAPALFTLAFVPLVSLVFDAASVPGEDMEKTQVQHNGSGGCLTQLFLLPSVLLAVWGGGLPVWLQWVLALVLVTIYGAVAVMFFDEGVIKLDKRRLLTKPRKPVYRRYYSGSE